MLLAMSIEPTMRALLSESSEPDIEDIALQLSKAEEAIWEAARLTDYVISSGQDSSKYKELSLKLKALKKESANVGAIVARLRDWA